MTREEEIVNKLNKNDNKEIKGFAGVVVRIVVITAAIAALIFLFSSMFDNGKLNTTEFIKFIVPVILIIIIMCYLAVQRDKFIKAILNGEYNTLLWEVTDKRKDKKVETYYDRDDDRRRRRTKIICVLSLKHDEYYEDKDVDESLYKDVEVGGFITEVSNQYGIQLIAGNYDRQGALYEGQENS